MKRGERSSESHGVSDSTLGSMSTVKAPLDHGECPEKTLDARGSFWENAVSLPPRQMLRISSMTRCLPPFLRIATRGIAASGAMLMLGLGGAQAQPAAAKPQARPPISAEPSMTTASFGDWVLRCQRLPQSPTGRVCEVAQTMQVQGQNAPVAQLAIGRSGKGEPLRATAVVPASVSFPSNVQLALDKDTSPLELDWRRCLPGGCFADLVIKDEQLKRWRAASEKGRLIFKDAAGRDITIPLSLQGLGPALDALANEAL